jgi:hypothetical protein
VNKAFWVIVSFDAALFLFLLIATLAQRGANGGGREMALFFGVLLPGAVIGLAVLLYVMSSSTTWRLIALLIVAGPGLLLAGIHLRNAYLSYVIRRDSVRQGYFPGKER